MNSSVDGPKAIAGNRRHGPEDKVESAVASESGSPAFITGRGRHGQRIVARWAIDQQHEGGVA